MEKFIIVKKKYLNSNHTMICHQTLGHLNQPVFKHNFVYSFQVVIVTHMMVYSDLNLQLLSFFNFIFFYFAFGYFLLYLLSI